MQNKQCEPEPTCSQRSGWLATAIPASLAGPTRLAEGCSAGYTNTIPPACYHSLHTCMAAGRIQAINLSDSERLIAHTFACHMYSQLGLPASTQRNGPSCCRLGRMCCNRIYCNAYIGHTYIHIFAFSPGFFGAVFSLIHMHIF